MKERPNILFLMTDEQRYDAAGWVNSQVHTPVLNRLAEESVWFSRAYTTNPSCIPARAAVFTGRYPSQCGVPGYVSCLPKRETTFMKYLQDGGYYTAVIGKQHFWRSEIERGYDYEDIVDEHEPPAVISKELPEGAFGLPANKTVSDRVSSYVEFLADSDFTSGSQLYREINSKGIYEFTGEEKYHVDAYIGDRGRKWLEESCPGDRPWFLTLSFPGPHMPFDGIGLPDEKAYEDTELDLPETGLSDLFEKPPHYLDIARKFGSIDLKNHTSPDGLTPDEIRLMKKAYYANVTLIDRKIGQVIEVLKKQGLYENTLLLFTSDHGDLMGAFGIATKAQYCSEALMRIPFLLKPPFSGFKGRREDSFISSVEIAATCLTAAGIAVPESVMGRSLTQFYEDGEKERWQDVYMEARDIRAIRDEHYKLIYYQNRSYGEFYDLQNDPYEKYNLWDDPLLQGRKYELMKRLIDRLIDLGEGAETVWNIGAPVI